MMSWIRWSRDRGSICRGSNHDLRPLGGGFDAPQRWRPVLGAAIAGAVAGVLIPLAGGELFAGSLKNLVEAFSSSRLPLDALGGLFGDAQFGPFTQALLGGLEILVFAVCVVGGCVLARQVRPASLT